MAKHNVMEGMRMVRLTREKVLQALPKIEPGLKKYCWIQKNVGSRDVSVDQEFQKRFSGFYRVRRGAAWREKYYQLMQASKAQGIAFEEALRVLKEGTGWLEASFASKLVATLDPTKPVIDKFVLKNLNLRLPYHGAADRERKIVGVYNQLCGKYEALMGSSIGSLILEEFQRLYPSANITDLKKFDLVLWKIHE